MTCGNPRVTVPSAHIPCRFSQALTFAPSLYNTGCTSILWGQPPTPEHKVGLRGSCFGVVETIPLIPSLKVASDMLISKDILYTTVRTFIPYDENASGASSILKRVVSKLKMAQS